jgi:hypothetical protein
MKTMLPGGTLNLELWDQGEKVTDLRTLKVGDILLDLDYHFRAQNLCRVTRLDGCSFRTPGEIVYAVFVDPDNASQVRQSGDQEFAIWDFDVRGPRKQFFRANRVKNPMNLTGSMIIRLMRQHRVTMRDIKARHGVTLKRIREVRTKGVRGFAAEEWFMIITGKWPDPGWSQTTP